MAKTSDAKEAKEEKYVYKNKQFDAKVTYQLELQRIKDRQHDAAAYRYHLIDLLRMSHFTLAEKLDQRWEAYRYTFNAHDFLLNNGLYIAILLVFAGLCVAAPVVEGTNLLTPQNLLNILQQASPRMFLALGVAGLILQTGTDLSIGRMVGMSMVASTVIIHRAPTPVPSSAWHMTSPASRWWAASSWHSSSAWRCARSSRRSPASSPQFKMHWFVSTMANMLVIFSSIISATKGVSFGAIDGLRFPAWSSRSTASPRLSCRLFRPIAIVWFIWNKTTFGKNMFAVGGNPEAAAVSGINVFAVFPWVPSLPACCTASAPGWSASAWSAPAPLRMAGLGRWTRSPRASSAAISFTGGIGRARHHVGVLISFTALTYALTILGIDTNLQFVFSGVIILIAVTLDCLKMQRCKK